MSKVYSVYELFDATGKVLYVGQSSRPLGRADKHAERVNWVIRTGDVSHERQPLYVALAKSYDRLVAGTDIMRAVESGFETRRIAEAAEKARVDWHNARGTRLYNKAGNHQLTLAKPRTRAQFLPYCPVDATRLVAELGINLTTNHPIVALSVVRVASGGIAPVNYLPSGRISPAFVVIDQSTYIFPFTKTELAAKLKSFSDNL